MPNPVLSPERWQKEVDATQAGWAAPAAGAAAGGAAGERLRPDGISTPHPPGKAMTVGGTFSATAVLLALLLATAVVGWMQVTQTQTEVQTLQGPQTQITTDFPGWVFLPMLGALGIAFALFFRPQWARVLAPLYALGFGFAVGAISHMYDLQFDGIVLQAVGATIGVFCVMLLLYLTRIIKVTSKFIIGVMAAMGGILLLYLAGAVASLFGADIAFWNEPTPLGIGISVVIVIVAALNLAISFNFVEQAIKAGAPRSMEWLAAYGLLVALVWLYLEVLRLLSLLRQ